MAEDGVGRRGFLGIAAALPLAPALAPEGFSAMTASPAMPEVAVGAGSLGAYAQNAAKSAFGIGPWLKTKLTEQEWKATRLEERFITNLLERYGYKTDHNVEAMKSWSPAFKESVIEARKGRLIRARTELNRLLYPDRNNDPEHYYD